jgi:tetratricopeptide (TPR) repeat protein
MKPFLLTMGLGLLAAIAGAPDAAAGLASSAGYFGTLGAIGYSREQESRADQAGATLLDKAGISGRGLAEFFDNFRYQEVFDEARRYAYFRTHPISSDRIEALRNRVAKQPNYDKVDSPEALAEHAIMKAKLDGFINPQVAITKYDEKATDYPSRYARAIAYYQLKEPDRALKLIDGLLAEQPNNPYLYELKGQILFEFGRTAEAEAPQRRSVELKPAAPLLPRQPGPDADRAGRQVQGAGGRRRAEEVARPGRGQRRLLAPAGGGLRQAGPGRPRPPGHRRVQLQHRRHAPGPRVRHARPRDAGQGHARVAPRHRHRPRRPAHPRRPAPARPRRLDRDQRALRLKF